MLLEALWVLQRIYPEFYELLLSCKGLGPGIGG